MKIRMPLAALVLCALLAAATTPADAGTNRVCLLVVTNTYTNIIVQLATYRQDLVTAGFTPVMEFIKTNGTPSTAADVRAILSNLYSQADSLSGAVLIGDVPHITYELMENWGGGATYSQPFPCDLYYMDLNGTWRDTNSTLPFQSGAYDVWTGNSNLEIWVCRMRTSTMTSMGRETNALPRYFDKNHRFRAGDGVRKRYALVYDDDGWTNYFADDVDAVRRVYGDAHIEAVQEATITTGVDFMSNRLARSHELVFVRGTSSINPSAHTFFHGSPITSDMNASDYRRIGPPTAFFSFGVPWISDFTVNSVAGTAVFNTNRNDSGLAAWGSTKRVGTMTADRYFYEALAEGDCIGEAFRRWFNTAQSLYYTNAPRSWYGMVLIGDATLRLNDTGAAPTNGNAYAAVPFSDWSAVAGNTYIFQRSDDLLNQTWSNISAVVTAQDYSISFSDANTGAKAAAYRVVRVTTPYTNLLRNTGFEIPGRNEMTPLYWEWNNPVGWTNGAMWGNAVRQAVAGGWRSHAGQWESVVCGGWFGNGTNAGIWQQAPAYPGTTYQASAWFWADAGTYGVWTAAIQQLKLEFYSTADLVNPLAQYMTNLDHIVESWTQKAVSAVAPANTAWARYVIYVGSAAYDGALQFDDAELKVVP